jgi:hypothetical protein
MVEIWLEIRQHDLMRLARRPAVAMRSGFNPLNEAAIPTSYAQLQAAPFEV